MVQIAHLKTDRLLLRQWKQTDKSAFAQMNSDQQVMAFYPEPLTRTQSDKFADSCAKLIEKRGWGFWAVEWPGVAPFIGFVGLHQPFYKLPFSPCIEIGWRLAYPYWGKGIATEAGRSVLGFAFEVLQLTEVVAFAVLDNQRSFRVMQRLGMQDSKVRFAHPKIEADSVLSQHALYKIKQSQWFGNNH